MKHRPTEIPYIPKDRRRSRLAPREGGNILDRNKGIEALRSTNARARHRGKGGKWIPIAAFAGVFAYSMIDDIMDDDPVAEEAPTIVRTAPVPAPGADAPGGLLGIFSTDDYPTESLRREEEGTVRARLTIDEQGQPIGCDIVQSSGFDRLDETTCRVFIQRGTFEPSRDANGNAVESTFDAPAVAWRIPG